MRIQQHPRAASHALESLVRRLLAPFTRSAALVAALALVAAGSARAQNNLVALYRFDTSTTADLAGAQKAGTYAGLTYNGTAVGSGLSLTTANPGVNGVSHSLSIGDTTSYVDLPLTGVDPMAGSKDFTVTCWFKTTVSGYPAILESGHVTTGNGTSGDLSLLLNKDLGNGFTADSFAVGGKTAGSGKNDGAWHFASATHTAAGVWNLAVDTSTATGSLAIGSGATSIRIGRGTWGNTGNGLSLSDVAIFQGVLGSAELAKVKTGDFSSYPVGSGVVGSLPTNTTVMIAAGATLDVSDIAAYTLGTGASLAASGTGTTPGTDAAAITGAVGGTVSLGARPVSLTWSGASSGTDYAHPPLVVSQGTLSLGGNTFTVVVPGTALYNGVYTLVTTSSAITGTVNATPSFTGGNGLAAGATGVVSISGNNVVLTVIGGVAGYASWAASQGITGTLGSGLDPAFDADPNKDGIQNGMAWILGAGALGNPAANRLKLPAVTRNGTGAMVLTFERLAFSAASAPLVVQYGDDLGAAGWTSFAVGTSAGTTTDSHGIAIAVALGAGSSTDYDRITVTISTTYMAAHPKTFARLMANLNP